MLTYATYAAAFLIALVFKHPEPIISALRAALLSTFPALRGG